MKLKTFLAFLIISRSCQLYAQKHLCLGLGFGAYFYSSTELDRFKNTYHAVNADNLAKLFDSFIGGEGIRFEASYRRIHKRTNATTLGWQFFTRPNNAVFNNSENRIVDLKSHNFYFENELGAQFGPGYLNAIFVLTFNRKTKIAAKYFGELGNELTKRLNGTYKTETLLSGDLGVAYWLFRKPFFIIFRASYPVFATDKSQRFRDKSPDKIADASDLFPDDYFSYRSRQPYAGISNNLDGLKISLTLQVGFEIFGEKAEEVPKDKGKSKTGLMN